MPETSRVSTGDATFDEILGGGLPRKRTVLFTGSPGTGKSTLAMQFLQDGLARGDRCLFISTEQTREELEAGFRPFDFELDHEQLAITTIQASPGQTVDGVDAELTLETPGSGSELPGAEFGIPFTSKRIQEYLRRGGSCDRVVLDSVSGLEAMSGSSEEYRRAVLDLVRLFSDEFGATTIFTAEFRGVPHADRVERVATDDAIQYNVHGVVRLWREKIRSDYHRFLDVMKMRGVAHDTRQFEIEFNDSGVTIIPRHRDHGEIFVTQEQMPTHVAGLDALCGGGLLMGTGVVLEHDGRANTDPFILTLVARALDEDLGITLLPMVDLNPVRLDDLLNLYDEAVDDLMADDRLFVLDTSGAWEDGDNVFNLRRQEAGPVLKEIADLNAGSGHLWLLNTEAKVQALGQDMSREFRYWQQAHALDQHDLLVEIHNPNLMDAELSEFHVNAAGQVLNTWVEDSGLQYLRLDKSPVGSVGSARIVEYLDEKPFVRVRPDS